MKKIIIQLEKTKSKVRLPLSTRAGFAFPPKKGKGAKYNRRKEKSVQYE